MKDVDGVELASGDMVYWRHNLREPFMETGKVSSVRETLGLAVLTQTSRFNDGAQKASRNIRKMSDEEAMLWRLENS